MPRFKLTIEYDGTDYVGWQRQDNGPSIQAAIEEAVRRYCQVETLVQCAGRTDSGVHARGQVAHVDLPRDDAPDAVAKAINAHLRPQPIAVINAERVSDAFHARFSAIERGYVYRILNRRAPPTLEANHVWWVSPPLDAALMHEAAAVLVGKHDFSSFRATACQSDSAVKTLDALTVSRDGDIISIAARARSFLHHQMRNITGTLRLVGEHRWSVADVVAARDARDRAAGGPTAPSTGLCLMHVKYPADAV
ncbi:MAG: tRNA pseudouridine(38-40) synthase TruA [Rhodospirillaceae bacterium]|nr:MAG: tRNA pseudouridine(38-40) synthase TruA [Rhodospirillaceae bacterium]